MKERYEKLLKKYEDCEKQLHPILIHIVMNKQEKTLVQYLIERTVLDINVSHINSLLLSDPPRAGDSEINSVDEPDRNSKWDLDNCAQTKGIVKKIYKRGIEVACVPITVFGQNICSNFDDDMLIFEWASLSSLKNIPYENMSKEDIIAHITQEGWDNKPEKRIRMDEILLKFSDIEAELNNKSKKNNLESVGRSTRNPRKSISDNRRHSLQPPNSNSDSKRYSLQSPNSISDYRRYLLQPSNSISDYKQHSLQLKSKENLAPNLESVGEYTSYAMKSPADFDSFMINQET
ncbi:10762_t:CDS:2 [Gigaspora margarita]|uniref:10762_t:CDS:1 n=1 Tax=Gigaspora margarita TaxID=4874 RepID=A0ABN7V6K3_GIGMA|nr:10762_t:CDS:2 [Gigaspora margarita]